MEIFCSKKYLLIKFLNFLSYKEIAILGQVNKAFYQRIDSLKVWNKIIERDYPNLMILSKLNASVSLSLLKNKTTNKDLKPDKSIILGVFGSLGIFQAELQENINLARYGFLGSIKEFVCNLGLCRFNIVNFPNVSSGMYQKRIIKNFLVLSKCEPGWEEDMNNKLNELNKNGIHKFVIGLRLEVETPFVYELTNKYKNVVLVDKLTRKNVRKLMKALFFVYNNDTLKNSEEDELAQKVRFMEKHGDYQNKRKCEVF